MTRGRWIMVCVVGVVLVVVMAGLGMLPAPFVLIGHLAVGWIGYLKRVVPQISISWPTLLTGVACLVGVLGLGHLLGRWLWRETHGALWRFHWTLALGTGVLLMFTAGIGAVGFAHQSAWLARSERPLFSRSRETAQRIRCAINLRQIGQALIVYAQSHADRLPRDFSDLLLNVDITSELFVCPATFTKRVRGSPEEQARDLHDGHCDYVYHAAGRALPLSAEEVVACEPLFNHDGEGMHILFGDGRVRFLSPGEANIVMRRMPPGAPAPGSP